MIIVIFIKGNITHPIFLNNAAFWNIILSAILIWALSHGYETANQYATNKLRMVAIKDHLTGLYNRAELKNIYHSGLVYSLQSNNTLCVILFDIDDFKIVNDQYGHEIGDEVLIIFANILKENTGTKGSAFRICGEEFVLILPVTSESESQSIIQSINSSASKIYLKSIQKSLDVSASSGLSIVKSMDMKIETVLRDADNKMYSQKVNKSK